MKHLFLAGVIGALMATAGCGSGSRVPWAQDMNAAKAIATDRNTIVMAVFTDSSKEICVTFEEKTLSDPAVLERIKEYVPVRLQYGDSSSDALGARLQVPAVPAVVFIRPNADIVHRCVGAMKTAEFLKQLDKVEAELKESLVPLK